MYHGLWDVQSQWHFLFASANTSKNSTIKPSDFHPFEDRDAQEEHEEKGVAIDKNGVPVWITEGYKYLDSKQQVGLAALISGG
jgi:hypothetical protein